MASTRRDVPVRTRMLRAMSVVLVAATAGAVALGGPVGEEVVHGSAQFAREGNLTTITAADKTIVNYQSFDIARPETVRFIQPSRVPSPASSTASRARRRPRSTAPSGPTASSTSSTPRACGSARAPWWTSGRSSRRQGR